MKVGLKMKIKRTQVADKQIKAGGKIVVRIEQGTHFTWE